MGDLATEMWRQAADAWYERDREAAAALAERDEGMDELHASLTAELAAGQMSVPVAMEMALVARDYERLGAHAVNIARRVVYLAGSGQRKPRDSDREAPGSGNRTGPARVSRARSAYRIFPSPAASPCGR